MSKSCLQICTMQRLFPWKYPSPSITESSILAAIELIWTWFIVSIYFVKNKLVWIKPICLGLVSDYCNSQIPEISTVSKIGFKMDCSNIPSSMWCIVTAWLANRIMLLMGVENKYKHIKLCCTSWSFTFSLEKQLNSRLIVQKKMTFKKI